MVRFRKLAAGAVALAAATTLTIAPVAAHDDHGGSSSVSGSSGHGGGRARLLHAMLTGEQEAPNPGDPDGIGFAGMAVRPKQGEICYLLAVDDIAPATMAHIHRGDPGVPGPVVVTLDAPTDGVSANCADVDPALAKEIANSPKSFYVNVHNTDFPSGAVRGQLSK